MRVQIHELQVQIHELRVQIQELRVQIHELRVYYEFKGHIEIFQSHAVEKIFQNLRVKFNTR